MSNLARRDKNLKMRKDIQDAINEADIYWKCSGTQSEHDSDLQLEEWYLEDPDAVINNIISIVGDYIQEVL